MPTIKYDEMKKAAEKYLNATYGDERAFNLIQDVASSDCFVNSNIPNTDTMFHCDINDLYEARFVKYMANVVAISDREVIYEKSDNNNALVCKISNKQKRLGKGESEENTPGIFEISATLHLSFKWEKDELKIYQVDCKDYKTVRIELEEKNDQNSRSEHKSELDIGKEANNRVDRNTLFSPVQNNQANKNEARQQTAPKC